MYPKIKIYTDLSFPRIMVFHMFSILAGKKEKVKSAQKSI